MSEPSIEASKKLADTAQQELCKMLIAKDLGGIDGVYWYERVVAYQNSQFDEDIYLMNTMMDLPTPEVPTCPTLERMVKFRNILIEEVNEINQIIEKIENVRRIEKVLNLDDLQAMEEHRRLCVEIMADLADVCADITVYCGSELRSHGMPLGVAQMIVMESNFTKLHNGKRVWNEELGKFEKGPNYLAPEPALMEAIYCSLVTP